jgi:hypothetical protein
MHDGRSRAMTKSGKPFAKMPICHLGHLLYIHMIQPPSHMAHDIFGTGLEKVKMATLAKWDPSSVLLRVIGRICQMPLGRTTDTNDDF